jgi:alpha-N-acetylglucosaminidase
MILEFGSDHIYNCDVFNEVRPTQTDPVFVSSVGTAVFNAMTLTDPDAVWLLIQFTIICIYMKVFNSILP